jgi:NTE family protein
LRAFEDNGIEIDMIAGTSIGSIVGAFYCNGYTSTDIIELLNRVEFGEIANLKMDTSGLAKVIDREIGSLNIEELKKPFRAVATELETGKEKVFSSGSVANVLCASSSMPPFFKPVVIDGARYVDGAFTNSIPADVVKGMGADYVIGIDLSTKSTKANLLKKIFPTYKSDVEEPWKKGYENSDVMLHPDLNEYSSTSFGHGYEMYDIGYQHALEFIPKIKKDLEKKPFKK